METQEARVDKTLVVMIVGLSLAGVSSAEEERKHSAGTAAAAGASTQVLASTALDYTTNSGEATDSPTQKILKRALVGAATGAAATGMSYEPQTNVEAKNT